MYTPVGTYADRGAADGIAVEAGEPHGVGAVEQSGRPGHRVRLGCHAVFLFPFWLWGRKPNQLRRTYLRSNIGWEHRLRLLACAHMCLVGIDLPATFRKVSSWVGHPGVCSAERQGRPAICAVPLLLVGLAALAPAEAHAPISARGMSCMYITYHSVCSTGAHASAGQGLLLHVSTGCAPWHVCTYVSADATVAMASKNSGCSPVVEPTVQARPVRHAMQTQQVGYGCRVGAQRDGPCSSSLGRARSLSGCAITRPAEAPMCEKRSRASWSAPSVLSFFYFLPSSVLLLPPD